MSEVANYEKAEDLHDVDVDALIPYKDNARVNEQTVKYVMNTIRSVGYVNPIIVDEEMVIVAGHTRLIACKKLGWKKIPHVKKISGWSEEQKRLYRLADNATAEASTWNKTLLKKEVDWLKEFYKMQDYFIKEPDEADVADEKHNDTNCDYPLVPKFSEKYDGLLILAQNDIDFNNLREMFDLKTVKSYKNAGQGVTRVITYEHFMEKLNGK